MTTLFAVDMVTIALCQGINSENQSIDVICPDNYVRRIQACEPHYSRIISILEQAEQAEKVPAELQEEFEDLVKKVCATPAPVEEFKMK